MRTDEKVAAGFAGVVALMLAYLVCLFVYQSKVESHCLRLGWAGASITWNFEGYCITRIDQTDKVVPWREAQPR